jgi:hypothetical protein
MKFSTSAFDIQHSKFDINYLTFHLEDWVIGNTVTLKNVLP